MVDEWGGLADLLANLIAKYASVLDVENVSDEAQKIELTYKEKVEFDRGINCENMHNQIQNVV